MFQFKFYVLIIFFTRVKLEKIYILNISDDLANIADRGLQVALDIFNQNNRSINFTTIKGNNNNPKQFMNNLCKLYEEMLKNKTPPDLILDNTKYGAVSDAAKAFSKNLAIPTVTTSFGTPKDLISWDKLTRNEEKYLIQILPHVEMIPEIVRAIVINQNFSTAAILSDNFYVLKHKYKSLLQNLPTRHLIADIDTQNPIGQLLQIKKVKIFNIFVVGRIKNIALVLNAANEIGMYTRNFAWHAITHEIGELQCECKKSSVIFARPTINSDYDYKYSLLKRYLPALKKNILSTFYFDLGYYTYHAASVLFKNKTRSSDSYLTCEQFNGTIPEIKLNLKQQLIDQSNILGSYGPFNITENGFSSIEFSMELYAVKFREGTRIQEIYLGFWHSGYGNLLNLTHPQAMHRYASIVVYRIAAQIQAPLVYEKDGKYIGYCIDMFDKIGSVLNFEYEIIPFYTIEIGGVDKDGYWTGLINELVLKRADILTGLVHVSEARAKVVDFTVPYYNMVGNTILMKLHRTQSNIFRFLSVFEFNVWCSIVIVYIFLSLFMWLMFKFSPAGHTYAIKRNHIRNFTFPECLWFCLISLTPQGSGEAPVNASSRFLAGAWWFFGFIMISSYSANLSAFLTVSRLETPVKSLDDLVSQYKISYSGVKGSSTMKYFAKMADIEDILYNKWKYMMLFNTNLSDYTRVKLAVWEYPLSQKYIKIWKAIQNTGMFESADEAVSLVKKSQSSSEGYAFITNSIEAKYYQLLSCDLQIVGEEFHTRPLHLAVQKGSPLKGLLNNVILDLYNKRFMQSLGEKWWNNNPDAVVCNDFIDSESIGIENIGGIFIYLTCLMISFVVWILISVLIKKFVRKKRNQVRSQ